MALEPFIRRALWTTRYGVRVSPSYRGYNFCAISGAMHAATADRAQLEKWNAEDPTFNVIAVPHPGEVAILDIDDRKILELLPQPLPHTLKIKSPHDGQHVYFKSSPKSDALGNRNVVRVGDYCVPDEKGDLTPLLELKVNNLTVAAAGSLNDEGISYKPEEIPDDADLAEFPDWLADWIAEHASEVRSVSGKVEFRKPHPDFDTEDFFEFHAKKGQFTVGDAIETTAQGCHHAKCYVAKTGCLWKGGFHEKSTRTGFMAYYNEADELIGFNYSCFAASCEGNGSSTITKLEEHLGRDDFKPYPYFIYEDEDTEWMFADPKRFPVEYDELPDSYLMEPKWDLDAEVVAPKVSAYSPAELDEVEDELPQKPEPKPLTSAAKKLDDQIQRADKTLKEFEQEQNEEAELSTMEGEEPEPNLLAISEHMTDDGNTYRLMVRPISDYKAVRISWLWEQRIPLGMVTVWTGKSDCFKTSTLLDVAARVSSGRDLPDAKNTMGGAMKVLYAASEDDPALTLRPRLMAAGANMDNIYIVQPTQYETAPESSKKKGKKTKKPFDMKRDMPLLKKALKIDPDIKLLVIDPLTSFFGKTDLNKDSDMRPLMDSLSTLARTTGIAVIGLVHSSKRSDVGSAVEKVAGATSVAASARAVWGFSRNPDDKSDCRMALVKSNVIKNRKGLKFTTEDVNVTLDDGEVSEQFRIKWGEALEEDADTLMHDERAKVREFANGGADPKTVMVKALLQQILPMAAADVFRRIESEIGEVSQATVYRARDNLKVISKPKGRPKWWYLPGQDETSKSKEQELHEMVEKKQLGVLDEFAHEI